MISVGIVGIENDDDDICDNLSEYQTQLQREVKSGFEFDYLHMKDRNLVAAITSLVNKQYSSFENNLVLNYFSLALQPLHLQKTSTDYYWSSSSPLTLNQEEIVGAFKDALD